MEQNKTFVVILVVSVSVAVLIATGLLFFQPASSNIYSDVYADGEAPSFDPYEYTREPEDSTGNGESVAEDRADEITGLFPAANFPAFNTPERPLILRQEQVLGIADSQTNETGISFTQVPSSTANPNPAHTANPNQTHRESTGNPNSANPARNTPSTNTAHTTSSSADRSAVRNAAPTGTHGAHQAVAPTPIGNPASSANPASSTTPSTSTANPARNETPSSTANPARNARTATPTITEYWIQLFSSRNQQTILDLSRQLASAHLHTKISSRKVRGTTHYRLRFGPFTEQSEAEKFLGWVRRLQNYEDAYISQELRH